MVTQRLFERINDHQLIGWADMHDGTNSGAALFFHRFLNVERKRISFAKWMVSVRSGEWGIEWKLLVLSVPSTCGHPEVLSQSGRPSQDQGFSSKLAGMVLSYAPNLDTLYSDSIICLHNQRFPKYIPLTIAIV